MLSYQVEENLEMRLVSKYYTEELFNLVIENCEHLHQWMPWANEDYSKDSANHFIQNSLFEFAVNKSFDLLIFWQDKMVGIIGFDKLDLQNKSTEIGYWLAKNAQGKGIISKCCRELVSYGFEKLELNRIVIRCASDNLKSQAIPERLGFTQEGIEREAENLHGKFIDLIVYSMLKKEWKDI